MIRLLQKIVHKLILNEMTPERKKANELWRKFANADFYTEGKHATYQGATYSQGVVCAIITIDEIIASNPSLPRNVFLDLDAPDWMDKEYALMFWKKVKEELEAMK